MAWPRASESAAPEGAKESAGNVSAAEQEQAQVRDGAKMILFMAVVFGVLLLDVSTKLLVQRHFFLYQQMDLIGDYVRLTYIYNPGAAFGIHLGEHSRSIFLVLSLVALAALVGMYWFTPVADRVRLSAIALICGGAVGNLIDRVRSESGVVDFIDVGVGTIRWPVFNVADVAVTTGAIILALSLWKEEQRVEQR
jgi:signal peptidase II